MKKSEKEVLQYQLNQEKEVLKKLESQYKVALNDIINKTKILQADIDMLQAAGASDDVTLSMVRSKVYQKQYQDALKKQIEGILDKLHSDEYSTIQEYLNGCYEDAFVGTMYNISSQGIPLIIPIDQNAAVKAIQLDSKISNGLYNSLGVDVGELKKAIKNEVARGIATSLNYSDIARNISNTAKAPLSRAETITRTEGHRIQQQSSDDSRNSAIKKGANLVKQWDSTLDGKTRDSHRMVDGEIREENEAFSNGLMFPGDPSGPAAEVVNCRCVALTRARWALDETELETLKQRAEYFGLDKTANFEEYKQKYLKAAEIQTQLEQAPKPKKEYLTEKKLKQNISDSDSEIASLLSKYGGDETKFKAGASAADQAKYLELLNNKKDWQEKLDKKLFTKEKKALVKDQMQFQKELDNFKIKTYSGIWKDDVSTADYALKQGSIQAKKNYFEHKLKYATDPDDIKKWQALLGDLDDFELNGKAYYEIQKKLNQTNVKLTNLIKSGKISSPDDMFSDIRKQNALWFDRAHGGFSAADKYFDPVAKVIHKAATKKEHQGFYTYTSASGGHNRPLAGFQKPWSQSGSGWEDRFYVGPKKVWIDFEGKGDDIRGLTTLIQKSSYDQDVWLQSGQDFATIEGFLGLKKGTLQNMTDAELQQFVGRRNIFEQFISTAVNEGGGSMFNSKPLKINFYAPKGSQMLYASDVGAFGKGENEMILQRGGTYEITKIYWGSDDTDYGRKKIFVDIDIHPEAGYDLFQQDPNEWTGSKKNYHD